MISFNDFAMCLCNRRGVTLIFLTFIVIVTCVLLPNYYQLDLGNELQNFFIKTVSYDIYTFIRLFNHK